MAENQKKRPSKADEAREELASNWAQMTASMVSPGKKGSGPAPLPVSALPLPVDEPAPEEDEPKHLDLPRNSKGELSPAQRARLGLDLEPTSEETTAQSAANAPQQAPPAGDPLPPPSQPETPRAQPQTPEPRAPAQQQRPQAGPEQAGPQQAGSQQPGSQQPRPQQLRPQQPSPQTSSPQTRAPQPAAPERNAAEPAAESAPAQQQPGSSFDFRAMEHPEVQSAEPALKPASDEPKLAPVSSEPKLAPARQKAAPSERATVRRDRPAAQPTRKAASQNQPGEDDEFTHVKRDRNVLTYGVAWTAFCVVVTGIVAFTSSMSGDPTASAGPGPLIPGLLAIAMGWIVVIAARAMGSGWWGLMIVPAIVLFVGPYVYKNVWAGSVEDAARSYLSTNGADILIDVDATSVISATKNTDRGCFAINRTRKNYDTEISVVTYTPETARQQADYVLAPRYAARIEAGGDRAMYRVFSFKGGRAPAIVATPTSPPLDCENTLSAPGSGASREDGTE